MQRSLNRILTTHTGSLPRPGDLVDLMLKDLEKPGSQRAALEAATNVAVSAAVRQQVESGVDVINDGEQGRPDYTAYIKDRLTGFDGPSAPPIGSWGSEFPELQEMLQMFISPFQHRPACSGPLAWKDWAASEADILRAKTATVGSGAVEAFMTSPSPGQIARYLKNQHYPSDEAYLYALADVMRREYKAIIDAGMVLQVDCPDLALSRHTMFAHLSLAEFRKEINLHVEALNHSLKGLPADRIRAHICWGSTMAPHHKDVPLKDVVDIVLRAHVGAITYPAATPSHEHEWKVWREVKLPDGMVIVPGVIDSTHNTIEHPEVVADRIVRIAQVVGRANVIAGTDCGFGTFAGRTQVDRKIVWMKLAVLAEGARRASKQLWQ